MSWSTSLVRVAVAAVAEGQRLAAAGVEAGHQRAGERQQGQRGAEDAGARPPLRAAYVRMP
jgi:hypothetical protein